MKKLVFAFATIVALSFASCSTGSTNGTNASDSTKVDTTKVDTAVVDSTDTVATVDSVVVK